MKRCRHASTRWYRLADGAWSFVATLSGWPGIGVGAGLAEKLNCADCDTQLPVGESSEKDLEVELLAGEIIADAAHGVGLGGHRPKDACGRHCHHWYDDENTGMACCYCGFSYEGDSREPCAVSELVNAWMDAP